MMNDRFRKTSSISSNDIPSPYLLRRRLSAPETIMRKHVLAQQRSESQESNNPQTSSIRQSNFQYHMNVESDPNLNRRHDSSIMRKSTLMRRLWGTPKPFTGARYSGSFYGWQDSFGKLSSGKSTHSLSSIHSSPEHIKKSSSIRSLNDNDILRTSPQHKQPLNQRNRSPKHQLSNNLRDSPKRKISSYSGIDSALSDVTNSNVTYTTTNSSDLSRSTSLNNRTGSSNTVKTSTETETEVYSNGTKSTRSVTTSYTTTFSDCSDSAYTNTKSNFSQTTNYSSPPLDTRKQIEGHIEKEVKNDKDRSNYNNINKNSLQDKEQYIRYVSTANESSTQTSEATSLNVISNVQLSQSTLDVIYNQVMQDLENNIPKTLSIKTVTSNISENANFNQESASTIVDVDEPSSFYLKTEQDAEVDNLEQNKIIKYMISNVGTGSPYSKPTETPQIIVPRYSALPRTASMEVNTSSGDNTDKESDAVSLVDSLEDINSPRFVKNLDDKPVRGDLSLLLPDNSDSKKTKANNKPAAFFIPIEINTQAELKAVSDHLPDKVKEKLAKRQQKREQKMQQAKVKQISPQSDSNYLSASESGNSINLKAKGSHRKTSDSPNSSHSSNKSKRKNKPLLPSIETFRKIKVDHNEKSKSKEHKLSKSIKHKQGQEFLKAKEPHNLTSKTKPKVREKLSPIYTTKNEYVCQGTPTRIYHSTEYNESDKRIEILEIMEYIDTSEKIAQEIPKAKSKIPVLVHQKLPKISNDHNAQRPAYLDFDQVQAGDSKLDQLIANILIDTLNNGDTTSSRTPNQEKDNRAPTKNIKDTRVSQNHSSAKNGQSKHQNKFEVIPEETSLHSSTEDAAAKDKTDNKDSLNNNKIRKIDETASSTIESIINNNSEEATNNGNTGNRQNSYKGKAAVAVVKEENFSTIPKGWITFYMLHKSDGSADSTSDEGEYEDCLSVKNNANAEEESQQEEESNERNRSQETEIVKISSISESRSKTSETEKCISNGSEEDNSSSSEMKQKLLPHVPTAKKFGQTRRSNQTNFNSNDNKTRQQSEWYISVSGKSNFSKSPPNFEMHFKILNFSDNNNNAPSQSDSGLGEDHTLTKRRTRFPKLDNKRHSSSIPRYLTDDSDDSFKRNRLPEISKSKHNRKQNKRCEPSISLEKISPSHAEQRQTRSNSRRYNLSRPKIRLPYSDPPPNTDELMNER